MGNKQRRDIRNANIAIVISAIALVGFGVAIGRWAI